MARRTKRELRIIKRNDNLFSNYTGIEVIRLSGSQDCWITNQMEYHSLPLKKLSYALNNGFKDQDMAGTSKRMKLLKVKQTCGVHQCVNPDHLVGTEKPYNPFG